MGLWVWVGERVRDCVGVVGDIMSVYELWWDYRVLVGFDNNNNNNYYNNNNNNNNNNNK